MENQAIKKNFKFKNNNSFIYINSPPKALRLSKTPIIANIKKKSLNINQNKINTNNNIDKLGLKKKPYINFNFNLIQNKNMNNQTKIRTITPNLKLREIVNKKFRENNFNNLNNLLKFKTEFPEISKLNPNFLQKSYIHTENNYNYNNNKRESNENIDRQLKLIFVMKNKISELNKIIKEKNKEILNLKNGIQINNICNNDYTSMNQKIAEKDKNLYEEKKNINNSNVLNTQKKENKNNIIKDKENNLKKSNFNKNSIQNQNHNYNHGNMHRGLTPIHKNNNNEIEKLNKEIQNLNKIISNLDEKYKQEIIKNKEFSQKFTFIKNCTFGMNAPNVRIDERIKNYENKIIRLEEEIFQYQSRENKKKLILSTDDYSNIHICLNALLIMNKIKEENILNNISQISFENLEQITNNICDLLKIEDNNLISSFINDYIIKNKKNALCILTFEELYKYNISNNNNVENSKLFSFLKEKCIIYDYTKESKIPIFYLRHIYNEFCFKNKKNKKEEEFFYIVYICKNCPNNNNYNNLYDIYYDNLEVEEEEDDEKIVNNFIETIMREELEKVKRKKREREINSKLSNYIKRKKINKSDKYEFNEDDFYI